MKIQDVCDGIKVSIDFQDHINVLYGYSGTGKSFLMKLLAGMCTVRGIKYNFIDYYQLSRVEDLMNINYLNTFDVILLDNADLYMSDALFNMLVGCRSTVIVSIKSLANIDEEKVGTYTVKYNDDSLYTRKVLI